MFKRLICVTSAVLVFGAALPSVTRADLLAHWRFDEGAGTTIKDSSGNGHHGEISGTPEWVPAIHAGHPFGRSTDRAVVAIA